MENLKSNAQDCLEKELLEKGLNYTVGEETTNNRQWYKVFTDSQKQHDILLAPIDLKQSRGVKIPKSELGFELKSNLWIALILFIDDVEPALYLIPSSVFETPDLMFLDNDCGEKFPHLSSWEVRIFSSMIKDIEKYNLKNFSLITQGKKTTITVYFDWNVLTCMKPWAKLKEEDAKLFKELFQRTENQDNIIRPFSNAHLLDLKKSYQKGYHIETYKDIDFISQITKNACLCKYWGSEAPKWHVREPKPFFNEIVENLDFPYNDMGDIVRTISEIEGGQHLAGIFDQFKLIPHNIDFKVIDEHIPVLSTILQKSRSQNNYYALMDDVIGLFNEVFSNPLVYKELRKTFKELIPVHQSVKSVDTAIEELDKYLPKTALSKSFTELYETNNPKEVESAHIRDNVVGIYMQLDYVGFKSDKIGKKITYNNLFNDALHAYYGSHCDYYVTGDKDGLSKTRATYKELKLSSKALSPKEFLDILTD